MDYVHLQTGRLNSSVYTVYVLYFAEMGKSLYYETFAVFNFADWCVGLVPRHTES